MNQRLTGQEPQPHMEINEISARAFRQFYRRGETPGILRSDEIDNKIQLEASNTSTELAIENRKNNKNQNIKNTIP